DAGEIAALRRASAAADRVAEQLLRGEIALVGRTEAEVSVDIARRLRAEGHERVNFAIVGSGPNSASPHHEPGRRVIGRAEAVVCYFGGVFDGYCSDITRTVFTGDPPAEFRDLYLAVERAQAAAVDAATVGMPCEDVDGVARRIIEEAGYGPHFIHRTGHGIGIQAHQDPYLVGANCEPLAIVSDVTAPAAPATLVAATVERFGGLDILVGNAGGPPAGRALEPDDDAFRAAFEANALTSIRLVREAVPHMRSAGWGRIC